MSEKKITLLEWKLLQYLGKPYIKGYLPSVSFDEKNVFLYPGGKVKRDVSIAARNLLKRKWLEANEHNDYHLNEQGKFNLSLPKPEFKYPPMPRLGEDDYGNQEIQYYGFHIRTENGDCTIDYRNQSNGYYGGNLSWDDKDFYGGVFGQNVSTEEWKLIS